MNLNKVFIIGNLTRDPELKTLPSGTNVVNFGMATNRKWTNQSGEKQEEVQFHNVVSFGKQAELINQYLKKGAMAMIEGRIQTRNWEAQDGSKRSKTEIVAERVQFGPRKFNDANTVQTASSPAPTINKKEDESLDTIEYPEENSDPDKVPF